jgi:tRNA A37 threonylcarbamoyladenosine modification protein TsaB
MSSAKTLIIQTALHPHTVTLLIDGIVSETAQFTTFGEVFAKLSLISIDSDTTVLVNRGPGSYAGIRTGIGYAYGLLHGGIITAEQIFAYSSFDLVQAASGLNEIFLKGLPRIASHTFTESKGYYQNTKGEISYLAFADLPASFSGAKYSEEVIEQENCFNAALLNDEKTYRSLHKLQQNWIHDLTPLYVNPVHITKAP